MVRVGRGRFRRARRRDGPLLACATSRPAADAGRSLRDLDRAARLAALLEVLLVVVFLGSPELARGAISVTMRRLVRSWARSKDAWAAAACCSPWVKIAERYWLPTTLAVERRRVVDRPEQVERSLVADPLGVEAHLDGSGVTGLAAADLLVAGEGVPAGVADAGGLDALDLAEGCLDRPRNIRRRRSRSRWCGLHGPWGGSSRRFLVLTF